MVGADVVLGSALGVSTAFVVSENVKQAFAVNTKLNISRTSFVAQLPNLTMCFTRPIESGRHWLTNRQQVLWAVGKTENGQYLPHASDKNDSSGMSQSYRSISIPEVDLYILDCVVLGPAIEYTMSWKRSGVFLDFCVSASSWEFTTNTWIAVGFAPAGTRMMQNADIIIGGCSLPPKVLHSDELWGYPAGNATVTISGASFTIALPSVSMCFTVPAKSLALGYQHRVIWAVGKLAPDGRILAHWSDAQDPTGSTQLHRSADGPRVNFAQNSDAGKDDPHRKFSAATSRTVSAGLFLIFLSSF